MNTFGKLAIPCAVLVLGALWFKPAAAEEIAQVCWLTDKGTLLRFSVTQTAPTRFTYTGIFDEGDGDSAQYAISGAVEIVSGGGLVGSFSGSKSTGSDFKTAIARVTIDPVTFAGSVEMIRQKYNRQTMATTMDFRTNTLTRTNCP